MKKLIIKDNARDVVLLKLTTDRHKASHGLSVTRASCLTSPFPASVSVN